MERICAVWDGDASWARDESVQPHEAGYLKFDMLKAREGLRWSPRCGLAETLERIVAWPRARLSRAEMHCYCNAELERYAAAPFAHEAQDTAR